MSEDTIPGLRVERRGAVLHLTLARPEKRNAIDDAMMYGLVEAITTAGRDDEVRAIVLGAEGEHFCAGFDVVARNAPGAPRRRTGELQRRLPSHAHGLIATITQVQTPVVCAVRGWAAGFGLALALAADFTVAADDARFWAPFTARGFTPDSGVSWLLPRRVGEVRARSMLELAEVVSGADAAAWRMIHAAVPAVELDAAVAALVERLAGGATVALGLTKWLQHAGAESTLDAHLRSEAFAMELSSRSEDFKIGIKALVDKTDPEFTGR